MNISDNANSKILYKNNKNKSIYYIEKSCHKNNRNYINLYNFLNQYIITKNGTPDYDKKNNIIDIETRTVYDIPSNKIPTFMSLLEKCRIDNINLHFMEKQQNDPEKGIGSGIMYDFDILTNNNRDVLDGLNFDSLLHEIFNIFKRFINLNLPDNSKYITEEGYGDFDKYEYLETFAYIIQKTEVIYDESKEQFKNGFHIIIPDIIISKNLKKFILSKILENSIIQKIFYMNKMKLSEVLDLGSASVPTYFLGSSKLESFPYKEKICWKITMDKGDDINISRVEFNYKNQNNNEDSDINLCYDMSLNFSRPNKKRVYYEAFTEYVKDIDTYNNFNPKIHKFDLELEHINEEIRNLFLELPESKYIFSLLQLLSTKRIENRNTWRDIIYVLSNSNIRYKPLAIWVSKRSPEKWDRDYFENLWETSINYNEENSNKLTIASLIRWVKIDDPIGFENLSIQSIKTKIRNDIFNNNILSGELKETQFAEYVYYEFGDKFITDYVDKKIKWFEFITESDKRNIGEIYKWREEINNPDSINIFLSGKLTKICRREGYGAGHWH
jgi:hypothetical protein